jgi:serine/threonine protein kinase
MNPNLRRLFDAVADLPPEQQRAALAVLTTDADLIAEVLRLCGHVAAGDGEIAAAIAAGASNLEAVLSHEVAVGDVLGAWRLTEKIGQGGMGSVFLAERVDGHFQQTAAVKVMYGLPTQGAAKRLAQERQILAGLTHPNIARLFDGGATPNGQPYLVLEYIRGLPIDEYCQSKQLGVAQIVALILPICNAIAFAHQRLIIHCDIKPGNILVNQAGLPSLLDFGIASLAGEAELLGSVRTNSHAAANNASESRGARGDGETGYFTQTTMRGNIAVAYTPRYASPEQKEGKPITTASDIYSLGRVLEELCLRDPEFAHPSAKQHGNKNVYSKAGLQHEELRAILDKACSEGPAARYESVQGLVVDIKNLLQGAKVEAATSAPSYSRRKWINQHWLKTAAAAVFLAVIMGSSVRVAIEKNRAQLQASNAEIERGKAETERKKAESARQNADTERSRAEVSREIAEAERAQAEAQRQTATAARTVAETAQRETQIAKDDAVKQRDVAEDARKNALVAEQLAVQERDRVVKAKKSTEVVNNFLGSIFDGLNPSEGGTRNASALDVVMNAEKRLDELKDLDPEAQAQLYRSISRLHSGFSDRPKAASYLKKAADAYAKAGEAFYNERVGNLMRASVGASGDLAKSWADEAVALTAPRKTADPLMYARALNAKMVIATKEQRYLEADTIAKEIESMYRLAVADPWTHPNYIPFRWNAALTNSALGRHAEAEIDYRAVLNNSLKTVPSPERNIIQEFAALADALVNQGKNEEAESAFTQAIARATQAYGAEDGVFRVLRFRFAFLLRSLERYDEAEEQYKKLEALIPTLKGRNMQKDMAELAEARYQMAELRGDYVRAISGAEHTAILYTQVNGEFNSDTADAYASLARFHAVLKQLPAARQYAERAVQMLERVSSVRGSTKLNAQRALATIEVAEGKPLAAIKILESVLHADVGVSARMRVLARREAALAWLAVAAAATTATEAEAARVKAIDIAREAQTIAEKSSGRLGANYISATKFLESLRLKG